MGSVNINIFPNENSSIKAHVKIVIKPCFKNLLNWILFKNSIPISRHMEIKVFQISKTYNSLCFLGLYGYIHVSKGNIWYWSLLFWQNQTWTTIVWQYSETLWHSFYRKIIAYLHKIKAIYIKIEVAFAYLSIWYNWQAVEQNFSSTKINFKVI